MHVRVLAWILFGVGSAVLPLLLAGIVLLDHDKLSSPAMTWEHGELLLISMTLLIAAVGELILAETQLKRTKIVLVAAAGFLIRIASVWYMDVWASLISGQPFRQEFVRAASPWFFLFALFNSGACIMLSIRKETK